MADVGWAMPGLARKWHWFVDGRSLCGGWMYFGSCKPGEGASDDDCRECSRKLAAQKAKGESDG